MPGVWGKRENLGGTTIKTNSELEICHKKKNLPTAGTLGVAGGKIKGVLNKG